ncbi:S-adenosyl-L-methionine-dependent methyltransferase [Sodiomyces alkalinus F11]|uniref:S-adenosyl-L-methionine-dependent methyltransferase n=1 Tax=Sodiomyces alkalinus (strain CBS 110278 / VKM F-3762 / F11) TaxID=1314773 RepID=A0A3N2PNA7_SODAK|nr:S-adenosyl-L-methionine-dependent methyltransferase [Sodiomyces alkalinus F11]ROT35910.1 S-adenosyl-L-methionine-dependent methyltransferase [Sodiomyces alkalinus F11]
MAKSRRTKKRKASRQHDPQRSLDRNTMSTLSTEGQTSDGALSSDVPESEQGTGTELTSVAGSEEYGMTSVSSTRDADDRESDVSDGVSTFAPPSEYPSIVTAYRSEMPYVTDQDVEMASTRSLTEQDLDYRWIHGRRYCQTYYMPNDEYEQCRLSLLHRTFLEIFGGEVCTAPIQNPQKVLDIGTGIGEWAMAFSDRYPGCEVIGTDISAIQPTSVPANCFFEIDDAELEWEREADSFDLVHMRDLMGAFRDWPFIYQQAYKVLKPGGWLEIADFDNSGSGVKSIVSNFPPDSDMHRLAAELVTAANKSGRQRNLHHVNPVFLTDAGFVDVKITEHVIPINIEANEGKLWLIACVDGMEALTLRLLTQYMGWEPQKLKEACYNVARDISRIARDPIKSKGLNIKVRVMIGRKPMNPKPNKDTTGKPGEEPERKPEDVAREGNE